jgi:hypothetical protein
MFIPMIGACVMFLIVSDAPEELWSISWDWVVVYVSSPRTDQMILVPLSLQLPK